MRPDRIALLLLLLSSLWLGGCWDRRELDENAYVLMLGIDRAGETMYTVTTVIAIPGKMAGGEGGGGDKEGAGEGKPYVQISVEAPTVPSALERLNSVVDRNVSFMHARALFMGEELAREGGLRTVDGLARFRDTRRTMFYIVTQGRAADFLKGMELKLEKQPSRFIEAMANSARYTGLSPATSQIHTFLSTVTTQYADPLTYYAALQEDEAAAETASQESPLLGTERTEAGAVSRSGGPNLEMLGAAAFRRDRMVGVLSGEEVRLLLMLQDNFRKSIMSIPDPRNPDRFLSFELLRGRPGVTQVDLNGARPRIQSAVTLEAELIANESDLDWSDPELQTELEAYLSRHLESEAKKLIDKTQRWGADVIGFGYHAVRHLPTIAEWKRYDWEKRYPEAEADVRVRVTFRRFGLELSPSDVDDD